MGRNERSQGARVRAGLAIATAALSACLIAAAAHAQLEQAQDVGPATGVDTTYTPVAKETEAWQWVAGAVPPAHKVRSRSATPYDLDLFDVAFIDEQSGLAGGTECEQPPPPDTSGVDAYVGGCKRVPVIYRYSEDDGWQEAFRGEGKGYVGSIAWIGPSKALAVGGTGIYPRREAAIPSTPENDPAGDGRAWLYDPAGYGDSGWHELSDLPAGMRGMTALDFSPSAGELGLAGAFRQLWVWRDGRFVKRFSDTSPGVTNQAAFRFRVREIRFDPPAPKAKDPTDATAVTSGCCDPDELNDYPATLRYDAKQDSVTASLYSDPRPPQDRTRPDSLYSFSGSTFIRTPGGPLPPDPQPEPASCFGRCLTPVRVDIFVTRFTLEIVPAPPELSTVRLLSADGVNSAGTAAWAVGVLRSSDRGIAVTPGAPNPNPPALNEPPSKCSRGTDTLSKDNCAHQLMVGNPQPGVGYGPDPSGTSATALALPGYMPLDSPSQPIDSQRSFTLFELPSYALNSFDRVPGSANGWAVGDRGAILQLTDTEDGAGSVEPQPPALGSREPAPLAGTEPYDSFRPPPAAGAGGAVPALAARPLEQLPEPRLVAAGAPDPSHGGRSASDEVFDVGTIVMSRDGSEGWALGSAANTNEAFPRDSRTTLFHYDGGSWRSCDPDGIPGQLPADPACQSLAPLVHYKASGKSGEGIDFFRATLVPHDNDDEFEVLAIGTRYPTVNSDPVIARYRGGGWELEDPGATQDTFKQVGGLLPAVNLRDVACVAPDDCWIAAEDSGGGFHPPIFLRFDGTSWRDCRRADTAVCGNQDGLLPGAGTEASSRTDRFGLTVAGERLYLFGTRLAAADPSGSGSASQAQVPYPMIIYRDRGGRWRSAGGGYDPAGPGGSIATADQGRARSLAVARRPDGRYEGWAVGQFGSAPLLHLPPGGEWTEWQTADAASDYLTTSLGVENRAQLVLPGEGPSSPAFIVPKTTSGTGAPDGSGFPILSFNDRRQRWEVLPTPFTGLTSGHLYSTGGHVRALAPDSRGGFWAAVWWKGSSTFSHGIYFYHYTDQPNQPVFEDSPSPLSERITALAGAPDGTIWAATVAGRLARYDRLTGWEVMRVPGWTLPKSTTTFPIATLAVAPDGQGVAVGKAGRIASFGPAGVRLDPAAGTSCNPKAPRPPCGTSRDLWAVSVAPDGSALAAGQRLLWRPAGEGFRAIPLPDVGGAVTGVSLPSPDRAWLSTAAGEVFAGRLDGSSAWRWQLENLNADGDLLGLDAKRQPIPLKALALDADGHGYAVGDRGLVLYREGDGELPWRRLDTGFSDYLLSVALAAGGGAGALAGGERGLLLTLVGDRVEVARPADPFEIGDGARFSPPAVANTDKGGRVHVPVVSVALLPGVKPGQAEAWAVLARGDPGASVLLHYASDPGEPLLDPAGRARPLPDAPAPRPGELAFAAFGKSDCRIRGDASCPAMNGSNLFHELVSRRVTEELRARGATGRPAFALFTGDVTDTPAELSPGSLRLETGLDRSRALSRWGEFVADRLQDSGVPLFAALGKRDLSDVGQCTEFGCDFSSQRDLKTGGINLAWRKSMAAMPAPWGCRSEAAGAPCAKASTDSLSFEPVPGSKAPSDGAAATHYALDVVERASGTKLARLVFLDTSRGSVAASDPVQQPLEPGGQLAWLKQVLCEQGSETSVAVRCTRARGERAIVVSTTPTYSHGPGQQETQTDAIALETILMQSRASVVVSGKLGWNGLYWATAPGVHEPCPGGAYQTQAPQGGTRICGQSSSGTPLDGAGASPGQSQAAAQLSDALGGTGAPVPPAADAALAAASGLTDVLPFVVAASAGGKLGPEGRDDGPASQGFWHGYTVVRLDRSGDPRGAIVEQRPILDWVEITAQAHVLRPGQRMTLRGVGREPVGLTEDIRLDRIDSPAITHRYDLVEADPERPWLPRRGADGEYVSLDPLIATIDSQTGLVRTGRGNHPRAYAIGMLSVGDHVATWPLVFEPRRSFRPKPAEVVRSLPAPIVASAGGASLSTPTQPTSPSPQSPTLNLQAPPAIPGLPTPTASPPAPPAPPAPPPPPVSPSATPLDLVTSPVGLNVAPQATVIPPPAPPIQPAPPGGARREARQRQAATQKSGADLGSEGVSEGLEGAGGDLADGPPVNQGSAMTRRDPARADTASITTLNHTQPSAWPRTALYGGGITAMAALLALGWTLGRPRPRRRPPEIPAPAQVRAGRRR